MVAHSILKNTQCIQIHIQQLYNPLSTFWLVSHYQELLGLRFTETLSKIQFIFEIESISLAQSQFLSKNAGNLQRDLHIIV